MRFRQFLEKRLTNISWYFFHLVAGRCIFRCLILTDFFASFYKIAIQCWHFWRDFVCQNKGTITLNYLINEQPRLLIFGLVAPLLATFHLLKFSLPPTAVFFMQWMKFILYPCSFIPSCSTKYKFSRILLFFWQKKPWLWFIKILNSFSEKKCGEHTDRNILVNFLKEIIYLASVVQRFSMKHGKKMSWKWITIY